MARKLSSARIVTISTLLLLLGAARIEAAAVTLAWNPNSEPEVTGYVVVYGTRSGAYTAQVNAGSQTQATLLDLPEGTYYFAVKAYTAAGVYSVPSAEITATLRNQTLPTTLAPDMDGDRRSDPMVWRPSTGMWYWLSSTSNFSTAGARSTQWGNTALGDVPMSGDIDGDKVADLVLWRASTGTWFWLTSSTGYSYVSAGSRQWGNKSLGDVPMLTDLDGDGASELVVWRASTGTWFWLKSSNGYDQNAYSFKQWGNSSLGDIPMAADFDGDGKADLGVWRPSDGTWYWLKSTTGYAVASAGSKQWGNNSLGDKPMVGDFDGDRKADLAVWRASTGTWFWLSSSNGYSYATAYGIQWGSEAIGDRPSLADMDGDGRADLCIWRPSIGTWFWLSSSGGYSYASARSQQWGSANDIPIVK